MSNLISCVTMRATGSPVWIGLTQSAKSISLMYSSLTPMAILTRFCTSGHSCIQIRKRCTLSWLFSVSSTRSTSGARISTDMRHGCASTKVSRRSIDDTLIDSAESVLRLRQTG